MILCMGLRIMIAIISLLYSTDIKEVGSFMPGPAKPLKPELEKFMSSSGDDGVILVTFGSMVDTLDDRIVATMNEAFSKLPQKVIWRINTGIE